MPGFRQSLMVLVPTLFLSACSIFSLGLRFGDFLILRQLDRDFDLRRSQYQRVSTQVDEHWLWFRKEGSLAVATLIDEHLHCLSDGLTVSDLGEIETKLLGMRRQVMERVASNANTFLCDLSEQQLIHFSERLEERNEWAKKAFDREIPPPGTLLPDLEQIQSWLGPLDETQEKLLATRLAWQRTEVEGWIGIHRRMQERLVQGIRVAKQRESCAAFWLSLTEDPLSLYGEDRSAYETSRAKRREWTVDLVATLTKRQQQHLVDRLKGYAKDFRSLAARP